jgi:hypothetical protein
MPEAGRLAITHNHGSTLDTPVSPSEGHSRPESFYDFWLVKRLDPSLNIFS